MRTKQECLSIIQAYTDKMMKRESFIMSVLGTIEHQGEYWSVYCMANCNNLDFGKDYGKAFVRLQEANATGWYPKEIEVFVHELSEEALNALIEANPKFTE